MSTLFYYAIPVFLITIGIEQLLTRRRTVLGYELKDSIASIAMGIGYLLIALALKVVNYPIFLFIYDYRIFDVPEVWWMWPALVVAEDFSFYWYHRAGHRIRLFWASHVNHHSSQRYNLSTALRQPWLSPIVGPMFWFPLALLGFDPVHIVTAQAISMLYQYVLHTELIHKLPRPIEWVFNTPSHHRVHHGKDTRYLDRNYGGIFIIWDRLLGTFEPEAETPHYGLTHDIDTFNPVKIAFHELFAMVRDIWNAQTFTGKLGYLLAPPGWREDGTGRTSEEMQRERLAHPELPEAHAPSPGARG